MARVFSAFAAILISCAIFLAPSARAEEGTSSCFGLLWCRSTEDGAVSTDGLLYLYSSQRKGTFSRLAIRPIYSRESDPEKRYLRRSVLWPFGDYERRGDDVSLHVFPFYWHERSPESRYSIAPPFYFDYAKGDRSYFHLFPFYGHNSVGGYYDRYFILGPVFMATRDTREDSSRYDFLFPLFRQRVAKEAGTTWLLPFYLSGYDAREDSSFRFVLPGYWSNRRPKYSQQALFPLFGKEDHPDSGEHRVSVLGAPPIESLDPLPTLALYEHRSSPVLVTDRFFPFYRYSADRATGKKNLNVLVLYNRAATRDVVNEFLFPLYSRHASSEENEFALIGWGPASLYRRHADRTGRSVTLIPFFRYDRDAADQRRTITFLGLPPIEDFPALSFYFHNRDDIQTIDRLFPFYRYSADRALRTKNLNVLALFNRAATKDGVDEFLFPLYSRHASSEESEFDAIGWGPASLFQRHADHDGSSDLLFPIYQRERGLDGRKLSVLGVGDFAVYRQTLDRGRFASRLFPFYRYAHDSKTGESDWDALFIYRHKRTAVSVKDALLPLYHYERNGATHRKSLTLLGLPPIEDFPTLSFYFHERDDTQTLDRFFPIYRYSVDRAARTKSLNVLGLYNRVATEGDVNELLFPLYSRHKSSKESEFGVIGYGPFSLGYSYDSPAVQWRHVLPFYFHWQDKPSGREFSDALGLYFRNASANNKSGGVLPLYTYREDRGASSVFLLGALELSLYRHTRGPDGTTDAFLPLYGYRADAASGVSRLSALGLPPWPGLPALSLYAHESSTAAAADRFFPIYDYRKDAAGSRLSVLGLPCIDGMTLSLYEHVRSTMSVSDRLFPIYSYGYNAKTGESHTGALLYHAADGPKRRSLALIPLFSYVKEKAKKRTTVGILGWAPASLYQHVRSRTGVSDRLFPFYSYGRDGKTGETHLGALLYRENDSPKRTSRALIPLFNYAKEKAEDKATVGVLGWAPYSLYQHVRSPAIVSDRLFPFYSYGYDGKTGETHFGALIYRASDTPARRSRALFPLFNYAKDKTEDSVRVGVIGWAPVSLYQHLRSPERTDDRIVGIYHYKADRSAKESEVSVLWPLMDYKTEKGGSEFSLLWWLVDYVHTGDQTREFRVLGGSAMALFRMKETPQGSKVEFNPIIPLYSHETQKGKLTDWSVLGFGRCTKEGRARPKALYMCW